MDWAYSTHESQMKMFTTFWSENPKGRDDTEDPEIDKR
jgi:hypothetical protein